MLDYGKENEVDLKQKVLIYSIQVLILILYTILY